MTFELFREYGKNKTLDNYGIETGGYNKMTKSAEWQKVEDTIFKFENAGDTIQGRLVGVEDGKTFGNKVYKLDDNGKTFTIFGTSVLETQMSLVSIGDLVKIIFIGTRENKKKGQNDIKLFDVFFKK